MAVSGCSTIDGFTPGVIHKCGGIGVVGSGAPWAGGDKLARAALDERYPGHAEGVSGGMHSDATQPGPIDFTGPGIPPPPAPRHPGPDVTVYVYKLADGSTHATGVACTEDLPGRLSCVGVASYPTE